MARWHGLRGRPGLVVALAAVAVGAAVAFSPFREGATMAGASFAAEPKPAAIDGARAYGYLKEICALGPRIAGTAANARQLAMAKAHFLKHGATLVEQPFQGRDPVTRQKVDMVNLVASWNVDRLDRVVICAHYDTRPHPDRDLDPRRRGGPFIGANDGASGVALMMEMAQHLKASPTTFGVDLVLFDGEELVYGDDGDYFLGSKEFCRLYKGTGPGRARGTKPRYVGGILLDMVGGKDLHLPQEPYSLEFAKRLVGEVWGVAAKLKAPAFVNEVGQAVRDDHLSMNDAGIPTIDVIDFGYTHWHTADDLPENCSPASLEQVGRVVTGWLSLPPSTRRR